MLEGEKRKNETVFSGFTRLRLPNRILKILEELENKITVRRRSCIIESANLFGASLSPRASLDIYTLRLLYSGPTPKKQTDLRLRKHLYLVVNFITYYCQFKSLQIRSYSFQCKLIYRFASKTQGLVNPGPHLI